MSKFRYSVKTREGKTSSGTLSAANQGEAVAELKRQQLTVIEIKEEGTSRGKAPVKKNGSAKRARVSMEERVLFIRQLSTMISSGIPLMEALEILQEQTDNPGFAAALDQIINDVRSGTDLSSALAKHPRIYSKIFISMVKAGEASGQLDVILTRLAEYEEASQKLHREIKAAMTYPVVSLCLIIAITLALFLFIIPKFEDIFKSLEIDLPLPTQITLGISKFLQNQWWVLILAVIGSVVLIRFYKRTRSGAWQADWLKLNVPIFGPLFQKVALSRFSRTFATLIKSGVPILGALEIVSDTSGNLLVAEGIDAARESVRQGESLGEPLSHCKVFPSMVTRMVSIGERSGSLEALLEKISEFYDQQVSAAVESLTATIEPVMIGVMGIMVGGIVLSVFLPIIKIQQKLGGGGG